MKPPYQGNFSRFPLKKAHFFTLPLPFTTSLRNSWAPRLKQLFAIVSIDPLAAVYQLHDLIEESFRLAETHLGEVDIHAAHQRFRGQRRAGEHAPGDLG
jgi:hypothetical protein